MKTTGRSVYNLANRRAIHFGVFLVMLLMIVMHSVDARAAACVPDEFGVGGTIARFDDTAQVATVFEFWSPRRLRTKRISSGDLNRTNSGRDIAGPGTAYQFGK